MKTAAAATRTAAAQVDFDLDGLARIRLVDPSPADVRVVSRQLGSIQASPGGLPDVLIRFVDRLPTTGPLRYLGVDDAAFTDDAFLVLRSKHKARARVQLALEGIGSQSEIVCERGLPAVPHLIPILNLTLLGKGVLPLHASAFVYEGTGIVTTGWSKGGKTEALLAFAEQGAEYVGDEWVYLSEDGRAFGIPEPVRLWDWHLAQLPRLRVLLGRRERSRLRVLRAVRTLGERMPRRADPDVTSRVLALLRKQLHVDVDPARLFGAGTSRAGMRFDRLFLVATHELATVTIESIDPLEVARRMVFSNEYERLNFAAAYLQYRFAFPEAGNELLERARELERELLERVFAGKPAYAVHHPYPCVIADLFAAMSPYCR